MLDIFIDADGCPVKDEVYKVAARYDLKTFVVANKAMNIPLNPKIEMVVVPDGLDIADDWIVENVSVNDIVVTADIPLADRCVKKQARVLGLKGEEFTPESMGDILATRDLMARLREGGQNFGGPAPFEKKDRSKFLAKLDQVIQSIRRLTLSTFRS